MYLLILLHKGTGLSVLLSNQNSHSSLAPFRSNHLFHVIASGASILIEVLLTNLQKNANRYIHNHTPQPKVPDDGSRVCHGGHRMCRLKRQYRISSGNLMSDFRNIRTAFGKFLLSVLRRDKPLRQQYRQSNPQQFFKRSIPVA